MILWTIVLSRLKNHCPEEVKTLQEALAWLYQTRNLSLESICKLTDDYISSATLRRKLAELGIPIRSRGGSRRKPRVQLTREEVETMTPKELARKYKVWVGTIYKKRKELLGVTER